MSDKATCVICGDPMPAGEEIFKFHGYSGPCTKPPRTTPKVEAVIEYVHREADGEFWLDILANREAWAQLGPFETAGERQRAHDDMLNMMRSVGAKDLPIHPQ